MFSRERQQSAAKGEKREGKGGASWELFKVSVERSGLAQVKERVCHFKVIKMSWMK